MAVCGITCAAMLLSSCGDQAEIYQKYLDQGERIYIGITDSLTVLPGNNRAEVKWKVDADPKLKDCVVKWSDADSVIVPIENNGRQWLKTTLNNVPEGEINFTAYTRDIYGNRSIVSEKTKKIYGESYSSTLFNRGIASVEAISPNQVKVVWNSASNCVGVNLEYTDDKGKAIKKFVKGDEMETLLEGIRLGAEFRYSSLFVPEEECIDTFVVKPEVKTFPTGIMLDNSDWTITASSDASHKNDGGKPSVLIDNDLNNYWHSSWAPDAPLPHWVLIDMKREYTILDVCVYKRSGNTDCKKVEVYTSVDGNSFTHVGDINYDKTAVPQGMTLTLDKPSKGRYLKCVITESYRSPFVSLAEIKVVGRGHYKG